MHTSLKQKLGLAFTLLVMVAGVIVSQEYLSREPYPGERRNLAGTRYNLALEMSRRNDPVLFNAGVMTVATGDTNGTILCITNGGNTQVIDLPNPTNNYGRKFVVVAFARSIVVLSNGCCGAATGFYDTTNYVSGSAPFPTYTINTNRSAEVWCTGTNFMVNPTKTF